MNKMRHLRKKAYKPVPFSLKQALMTSILISLILNAVLLMGVFYGRLHNLFEGLEGVWWGYLKFFLWHFGSNILFVFLLFLFNFYLIKSRYSQKKKYILTVAGTLLICFALSPIFSQLLWVALSAGNKMGINAFMVFNLIKDTLLGIIVILITYFINAIYKREQVLVANQKLREENILFRYEALKNQLDPHFLFNSLNTLNGLIGTDDDSAHEYVENLSSVFRYTLHNKIIVKLEDEIEFANAYISMLQIRYGQNMQVSYDIDRKYFDYYILPAALQLLVENSVKHNVISNKNPLEIKIYSSKNDSITVCNQINPKAEKSIGGVGLANLTERYSLLFNKKVQISSNGGFFRVEVPLVKHIDKKLKI